MSNPQFFRNPDNNHCLQAALMIVFHAIKIPMTWNQINSLTDYEDHLWSWAVVAIAGISQLIPSIKFISGMDYNKFAKDGEQYFKQINNPEWFDVQKAHASPKFKKEQQAAKEIIKLGLYEEKNISVKELEELVRDNFLITLIDAGKLAKAKNPSGHFVVVYNSNGRFKIHDPGPPPNMAWRVDKKEFINAYRNELIVIPKV